MCSVGSFQTVLVLVSEHCTVNVRGWSEASSECFPLETYVRICRWEESLCHWVWEATQGSAYLTTIQVIWLKRGCGQSSFCLTRTTIRITWWLISSAWEDPPPRGSDHEEHSVLWLGEGTRLVWNCTQWRVLSTCGDFWRRGGEKKQTVSERMEEEREHHHQEGPVGWPVHWACCGQLDPLRGVQRHLYCVSWIQGDKRPLLCSDRWGVSSSGTVVWIANWLVNFTEGSQTSGFWCSPHWGRLPWVLVGHKLIDNMHRHNRKLCSENRTVITIPCTCVSTFFSHLFSFSQLLHTCHVFFSNFGKTFQGRVRLTKCRLKLQ